MDRKKRVLYHSDFALAKTGFGRVAKSVLSYLYKAGKYDLVNFSCGISNSSPDLERTPWKSVGAVPSDGAALRELQKDPGLGRAAGYGALTIDEAIKEHKPDVYIGVQDFWGVEYSTDKSWFSKINSCIWTTLDSLPILPAAIKKASKIPHYWVWSTFAEKALKQEGHDHVKTIHGPIEVENFRPLPDKQKEELRKRFNIPQDCFVVGFVFRNQLRKLVPNLLEGYSLWKKEHPEIKNTRLLFHTNFSEGWNIEALAKQYGVDSKEILTTFVCKACREYEVKSFDNRKSKYQQDEHGIDKIDPVTKERIEEELHIENQDCHSCKTRKVQVTTGVGFGVSEEQLNEVYNLMDVYCHVFTSGGQEVPIFEAKLAGLITLVTNYSCGEDPCAKEAYSLPLDWAKYTEHGTEFIKASTYPSSIAKQLHRVYKMKPSDRKAWGEKARQWTIENYSIQVIGKKIEDWLDSLPFINSEDENIFDNSAKLKRNPSAVVENIPQNREWVKSLYSAMLGMEVEDEYDGLQHWCKILEDGGSRQEVEDYFRHVAQLESQKDQKITIDDLFIKNNKKRLLLVQPESLGDCFLITSLFPNLRERYPENEWDFYVSTKKEYKDIFDGNDHVTKWIPYHESMDNQLFMEGFAEHKGFVDVCYNPYFSTQKTLDYTHSGIDKLDF